MPKRHWRQPMAKKPKNPRVNNPARDGKGRFIGGPCLEAGALDKDMASAIDQLNLQNDKDKAMQPTPATEVTKTFSDHVKTALTTPMSAVTPDVLAAKVPASLKPYMDATPASVVVAGVSALAYGIYRKFFKKTPSAQ